MIFYSDTALKLNSFGHKSHISSANSGDSVFRKNKISVGAKVSLLFVVLWAIAGGVSAQKNTSYEMDEYTVYYNVFNSTLILPEIASTHDLVRARDRVYVNVSLVKKSGGNGIPANVSGHYRNLIQQRFDLEFIEIKEPTATYYLAPIRFNNEEIVHVDIVVSPLDGSETAEFTVTKKLYQD
ncbi:MAG: hypothetical protein ACI82Z_001981 [Cellvibrionaceae bacterium]|jgi:hypothetical protein